MQSRFDYMCWICLLHTNIHSGKISDPQNTCIVCITSDGLCLCTQTPTHGPNNNSGRLWWGCHKHTHTHAYRIVTSCVIWLCFTLRMHMAFACIEQHATRHIKTGGAATLRSWYSAHHIHVEHTIYLSSTPLFTYLHTHIAHFAAYSTHYTHRIKSDMWIKKMRAASNKLFAGADEWIYTRQCWNERYINIFVFEGNTHIIRLHTHTYTYVPGEMHEHVRTVLMCHHTREHQLQEWST